MSELPLLAETLSAILADPGGDKPRRICGESRTALSVSGMAVSMMTHADDRVLVCATDDTAEQLEELQFSLGEGPCIEGFSAHRPVLVADLAEVSDERWPMFAAAARRHGPARAIYVFPLQVGTIGVGVLDLYRVDPGGLRADELRGALLTADAVLWTLLNHGSALPPDEVDGSGPGVDLLDHAEIHQATGMITVQAGVSAADALAQLRAYAFAYHQPIDEVARAVVARRLRFDITDD